MPRVGRRALWPEMSLNAVTRDATFISQREKREQTESAPLLRARSDRSVLALQREAAEKLQGKHAAARDRCERRVRPL
jgi:hypothetical protein